MELRQLRGLIEQGRVAKLEYYLNDSKNYRHEAFLQRQGEWILYQLDIYLLQAGKEQWLLSRSSTRLSHWNEVSGALDREVVGSMEWAVVDEQLAPFPARKKSTTL